MFTSRRARIARASAARPKKRPLARLRLTWLEDRVTPSNLLVTDGGDTGGSGQLRALLATANSNSEPDTITFDASVAAVTLTSALPSYAESQSLTITGNGKLVTTINAPPGGRIFNVSIATGSPTVTISDLTLKGGKLSSGNGGAISITKANLVLLNVRALQNSASAGGAVFIDGANLTISGSEFSSGIANSGAGVYVSSSTTISLVVSINNSTFDGNQAQFGGTAVAWSSSTNINFASDSCSFTNGKFFGTPGDASAISVGGSGSLVMIDHATFSGNTTAGRGGAISCYYPSASQITVKNSLIISNSTSKTASAIYVDGTATKLLLDNDTISQNTMGSFSNGGAIWSAGITTIANSTFSGNSAGSFSNGGVIYSTGSLTVAGCSFENNVAYDGGAIYSTGSLSLSNSIFSGNSASGNGGAIKVAGSTTISACVLTTNKTNGFAGAVFIDGDCSIDLSDFTSNTSAFDGGAIAVSTGMATINQCVMRGNVGSAGGAIRSHANVAINQCTLVGNTAKGSLDGGGAIEETAGVLGINNCTIYDNTVTGTAARGGGLLHKNGVLTINSSIVAGNKIIPTTNGRDLFNSNTSISFTLVGNNSLFGSTTFVGFTMSGAYLAGNDTTPLDPLLNPLADDGGPLLPDGNRLQTMSLKVGSPALDMGNNTPGFATDQRGVGYVRTSGAKTDVGAFEFQYPPTVTSVVFGDGTDQRSLVKRIVVTFSEAVTFTGGVASAFTLTRTGTNGPTGNVTLSATPANGPTSSVTITFSGGFAEASGSLVDGLYDFIISAAQVSGVGGALDGNNDGTPGGSYSVTGTTANKFYRLFGESDGNATIDLEDYSALRLVFGLGSNTIFDFDGDGQVDLFDFAQFRRRFGLFP